MWLVSGKRRLESLRKKDTKELKQQLISSHHVKVWFNANWSHHIMNLNKTFKQNKNKTAGADKFKLKESQGKKFVRLIAC